MLMFNHRYSKDIDIFLADRQMLPYVSPRVNDGAGGLPIPRGAGEIHQALFP
ncbi:MAG: hypothetical protein LBL95_01520 [Deltaproteobacteria bacterium]|nr:hypothetical protein [Deltaproteobacteria bacterium]